MTRVHTGRPDGGSDKKRKRCAASCFASQCASAACWDSARRHMLCTACRRVLHTIPAVCSTSFLPLRCRPSRDKQAEDRADAGDGTTPAQPASVAAAAPATAQPQGQQGGGSGKGRKRRRTGPVDESALSPEERERRARQRQQRELAMKMREQGQVSPCTSRMAAAKSTLNIIDAAFSTRPAHAATRTRGHRRRHACA